MSIHHPTPRLFMPGILAALLPITLAIACNAAGLVTTSPVTQDRDHATYNWQNRHAEILGRNQQIKPDVVIFGDSIIHYWGGEPKAPMAWGAQAWADCFAGIAVENLGFGWDRTENVLWRIEHGELDAIEPKVIIIKIGTNNIGINTPEDIATGVEAVCHAAHEKQPTAKLLLLGILPRRDDDSGLLKTGPVNQLLATRFSDSNYVTFRDFGTQFRDRDGTPTAALFADGVHINAKGYAILGTQIRAVVTTLLKPRKE
ncbi:MAG: GDSL-type esterase/lipase family protein [Verrucomicrobiota bacterium]